MGIFNDLLGDQQYTWCINAITLSRVLATCMCTEYSDLGLNITVSELFISIFVDSNPLIHGLWVRGCFIVCASRGHT